VVKSDENIKEDKHSSDMKETDSHINSNGELKNRIDTNETENNVPN